MKSARQFESAGIGLDICTTVRLNMAIKSLVNAQPVKTAKFWGKIYGLMQNYYVVEAEFQEGEDTEDQEEDEEGKEEGDAEGANDDSEDGENDEETKDVLPKSKWKQPPKVPREPNQVGVNKKVYFVCHEPGLRWIRLPPVTPQQIRVARSIRRLFTGNLDAPVKSYPPFPGNEANYLRAQIARISASTQISPEGYYHFGNEDEEEEEMEDEEGGERQRYTKNEEYEPLTVDELANRNLEHWVHHTSYILPQGRVTWWNPSKNLADDLEEFNEEEENGEGQELPPQPERGPPILTSIASDAPLFGNPPWTVRKSSRVLPEFASVILSSGLWPGAHALAWDKDYDNLYIGWGLKATGPGFHPHLPSSPLTEYQDVPEISEATDPTPQEEAALRAIGNAGEGEEAEGQEEAEEDEQAEDAGEQE
ncbi:unnamed protein product [Calicophoron daubneyi]|uniref:Uncharacterized protein n=1 Tax=Calicophoron daubneyi TaxID=300641 RepID=A0AAV2TCP5_CALDB